MKISVKRKPKKNSLLPKILELKSTICCCSVAKSCLTLCNSMDCSMPGFPIHHQLPELAQTHLIESVMPSNHLILCRPLLLLPSIFSSIRVFSNESALHIRWPKYWSFSFSISPSNEHPGLISFRMDCLDLPAVQGTFKCLLQHHSSKASILQCSAFFIVQLSHPCMTTGKGKPYRTTRNTERCQTTHSFTNSLKKSSFSLLELCWHWQNKGLSFSGRMEVGKT